MSAVTLASTLQIGERLGVAALTFEIEGFEGFAEATFQLQNGAYGFWEDAFWQTHRDWGEWEPSWVAWSSQDRLWSLSHMRWSQEEEISDEAFAGLVERWLAKASELLSHGWGKPIGQVARWGSAGELTEEGWGPRAISGQAWIELEAARERAALDKSASPGKAGAPAGPRL